MQTEKTIAKERALHGDRVQLVPQNETAEAMFDRIANIIEAPEAGEKPIIVDGTRNSALTTSVHYYFRSNLYTRSYDQTNPEKLIGLAVSLLVTIATPVVTKHLHPSNRPPAPPGYYYVTEFVDGDTVEVDMNGSKEKIRFIGVDTPETHRPTQGSSVLWDSCGGLY